MRHCILAAVFTWMAVARPASADRLKELVSIEGARPNQLTGFGIVVGLSGTGDDASSAVTRRSLSKMLKRLGVTISPSEIKAKNVAAVIVTGELPAFGRQGMAIDVTVSSMGSSKSLQGGTLVATPLKGADLTTYALAQGAVSVGGFAVSGGSGSTKTKNHVTVARIPGGGTVETDAPSVLSTEQVVLLLNEPDFTTAARIAAAIDTTLGDSVATVRDPGEVVVDISEKWRSRVVQLIATLESIEATPDVEARVIIDERTGTVVVGEHVSLGAVAIAHGGITVQVNEAPVASQPGVLSGGETVVVTETDIVVTEEAGSLTPLQGGGTVADVAAALNSLGVKPRDLVSIFQALKAAGALRVDVQVL